MMNLQVFVLFLCLIYNQILHNKHRFKFVTPFSIHFFFGFYTYIVQQKCIDFKTAPYSFENNSRIRLSNELSVEKKCKMLMIHFDFTSSKFMRLWLNFIKPWRGSCMLLTKFKEYLLASQVRKRKNQKQLTASVLNIHREKILRKEFLSLRR